MKFFFLGREIEEGLSDIGDKRLECGLKSSSKENRCAVSAEMGKSFEPKSCQRCMDKRGKYSMPTIQILKTKDSNLLQGNGAKL